MKKLLSTVAAIFMAGGIAYATNVPLITGPVDVGAMPSVLNNLIQSINSNVGGLVGVQVGPINSTATTAEQTLASFSVPANTIGTPGQTLELYCGGLTGSNTNNKTAHLYYGTTELSTGTMSTSAETWYLQMLVTNASKTQPNSVATGFGMTNTTGVAPIATNNTTDDLTTALTAKCTVTQGTSSASDTTLETFIVRTVK